jgi:hypothetical protein
MQPQQTHLIYEFGDFELDALRRVLVSRADGRQVEVTGLSFSFKNQNADVQTIAQRLAIHQLPAGRIRDLFFALAHFVRGDVVEGDAMLARLLAPGRAPGLDSEAAVSIAEVYAVKNDPDQAFKWLDFARRGLGRAGVPISGKELSWMLHTAPFLQALHADSRWKELLAAVGAK